MKHETPMAINLIATPLRPLTLLTVGLVAAVFASASAGEAPRVALEEVVVTAQKRSESMQDVPVAVDALSADQLAKVGFRDVDDIAAQVPSLIVTSNLSPLNASFRIRRIGTEGNIPTFEPDTALIIDGAFRSRSGSGLGDLVDVSAVEVLKGPQGTLYGKNASAGVISINTTAPTAEYLAMLELGIGGDGLQQLKGYVNGEIGAGVNGRLSVSTTRRDDLMDNLIGPGGDNLDGQAIRLQLSTELTDQLAARLIVGRTERHMNTLLGDTYYGPRAVAVANGMAGLGAGSGVTNNDPSDRIIEQSGTNDFDQEITDAVLQFDYAGDGFTIASISGYEDYISTNLMYGVEQMPSDLLVFNDRQKGSSFSQEFRITSDGDGKRSWLAGLFYYQNEFARGDVGAPEFQLQSDIATLGTVVGAALFSSPMPTLFGSDGDAGDVYATQKAKSYGLFGSVGQQLSDSLKLDVGLRYSLDQKTGSVDQKTTTTLGCIQNNLVCSLTPDASDFSGDDSWSAVTGNITLSYFVTPDAMVYGTYSHGFKAGGFSLQWGGFSQDARPFNEETIDNLELGWKTELWDNRARINGSIFHTEYKNFQNATFVGLAFAVNNAEKVVVDGIELDTTWLLTDALSGRANIAYIDAKYDQYSGGQCHFGREAENDLGQCDLSGETLPFAPKLTANLALEWEHSLAGGDFYSRLDYAYTGSANYSSELDPRHAEGAYWLGSIRVGWRAPSWEISAWMKNLHDEVYYVQKTASPIASKLDAGESVQAFTGTPRTYGVTLRLNF